MSQKSPFKSTTIGILTIGILVARISAIQTLFNSHFNIFNLGRSVRGQITDPMNSEPPLSLKITFDLD